MPTPIRGQSITAPPKVDATLSNTSSNTVQNQAVANALAGAYDATATYSVGDLCIYDGILYECTTAIATAEAWDATHWKTSNFGDAVSGLNRQISDKITSPTSPASGAFLVWDGTAWVAQTLATWQGGSY